MKKACMVVHSYYPADPRVRRETEALISDGWAVDIICLRDAKQLAVEQCGGATVYRLPVRRHRGGGIAVYLLEYLQFSALAAAKLAQRHLRQRYDVVQVHNMPDFLVFTAIVPRLMGARVVLDIHDLVPELYTLKFGGSQNHPFVRLTRWFERASTGFAHHVITAGSPFRQRLVARGVPADKVTVVMNSADPQLFQPLPNATERKTDDRFKLVYHGGLFERYGMDIAIKAVDQLRDKIPNIHLSIYGQGEAEEQLAQLVTELNLHNHVHLGGFTPIDNIPNLIGDADLGLVPYRQNPFTDLLYPTKAFEYIVMDVPVVMARTGAVVDLFAGVPDMFFQPEDVDDLAARILVLYQEPERLQRLLHAARTVYAPYAWESQRQIYRTLMRQLTTRPGATPQFERY